MKLRTATSLMFCLVVAGCATGPATTHSANASPTSNQSEEDLAEKRRLRRLETMAAPIPQRTGLVRGK